MSTEVTETATEVKVESDILSEEQIKETLEGTPDVVTEEVLPSDVPEFEMPEKFQGKTAEEIAKSYMELEKMKGGDSTSNEESPSNETQTEEPNKEVDPEYEAWKKDKALKDTLEPIGGLDKYKEALAWAKDNLSSEELTAYDNAMKATNDVATIRLLAKGLISQATPTPTPEEPKEPNVVHSNAATKTPKVSGYETKSDMMKDMTDPRYDRDAGYRAKVEAKVAKTDESKWYAGLPRG